MNTCTTTNGTKQRPQDSLPLYLTVPLSPPSKFSKIKPTLSPQRLVYFASNPIFKRTNKPSQTPRFHSITKIILSLIKSLSLSLSSFREPRNHFYHQSKPSPQENLSQSDHINSNSLMDSTPPSHRSEPRSRLKSASRLARIGDFNVEREESPHLSLDLILSPPTKKTPSPSTESLRNSNSLPIHELLLLSPSPRRKSKTRLTDRLEMAEEPVESNGSRRRCKSRAAQMGLLGCASPRNSRRSRRRSEIEIREEKEPSLAEEIGKPRKRRHSGRSKKEKLCLVPLMPSSSSSPSMLKSLSSNSLLIFSMFLVFFGCIK